MKEFIWEIKIGYDHVPAVQGLLATWLTSQKIILITNQAIPIKIKPVAACFKIVNHFLYPSSSPAEVTIRNHPYIRISNAISARIPRIQFTAHLMTLTKESCCHHVSVQGTLTSFALPLSVGVRYGFGVFNGAARRTQGIQNIKPNKMPYKIFFIF